MKKRDNLLFNKNAVKEYYDKCQKYYDLLWSDKESLGMHYGFWYKDTKSKKEALLNQYREVIRLLKPKQNELLLDAGCGIGGGSIWLAEKTNARFIGITLSSKQVELAKKYALKRKVLDNIKFYKMDYFKTRFKNETFDKIFAIESFCCSYPHPINVLKEMYRILKKRGSILMSDGILLRYPKNNQEQESFKKFCLGWKLNGVNTANEIVSAFKKSGFRKVKFIDNTKSIKKNANQLYLRGIIGYPILKILRFFRLVSQIEPENFVAAISQKKLIESAIMGHGIFYAEK